MVNVFTEGGEAMRARWCKNYNLSLNVETKEMVTINFSAVERVSCPKFMEVHNTEGLLDF